MGQSGEKLAISVETALLVSRSPVVLSIDFVTVTS